MLVDYVIQKQAVVGAVHFKSKLLEAENIFHFELVENNFSSLFLSYYIYIQRRLKC